MRPPWPTLLLAASCNFSPTVPDCVITCTKDSDCPAGLICTPSPDNTPSLCCRAGTCPPTPLPTPPPPRTPPPR